MRNNDKKLANKILNIEYRRIGGISMIIYKRKNTAKIGVTKSYAGELFDLDNSGN